jgi:hypothetical protein
MNLTDVITRPTSNVSLLTAAWPVLRLRTKGGRPPDMEGRFECVELAVAER